MNERERERVLKPPYFVGRILIYGMQPMKASGKCGCHYEVTPFEGGANYIFDMYSVGCCV